ncbi:MAG: hypothetical protein KAJ95_00995, partial [Gammaproteobacteria bacterium]|nr:hypothetical protein [Gammaproteobacteria bacterium]
AICLPGPAEAYYDDMHYHFTYYMARSVGYTPEQAYRIASANVSIDWAPKTEPVQKAGQFAMWGMAADSYALDPSGRQWAKIRKSWVSIASTPRIKFHAMMDCLNWPLCHSDATHQANALKKIPLYREQIWRSAKANGNLGGFLHFLEDEPAHEGYPSDNGHWAAVDMWWHNHQLRMGSATDYIDFDGNDGNRDSAGLINRVIGRMSDFMTMIIPKQQPGKSSPTFSSRAISNVYRDLRRANPVSNAPGFQDSLNQAAPSFNVERDGSVSLQGPFLGNYAKNFWTIWKTGSEPSSQPAYSVITQALGDQLKSLETNYPYKHFQYDLDANGDPVGQHMVDQWVLAGNLHLDFVFNRDEKQDFSSRSINVIIRSIPTFEGEKPYVLDQADSLGTMLFENLPIGAVRIEVYTLGKLLRERTVTLLKEDTYIRLAIDLESEASQLELDKHLERMRELLTQLKKDQTEFEKTDEETKGIINALNELVSEIKELSVVKTGDSSLSDQARELVELSKRQTDWAREIENGLQSITLVAEEAQRERDFICSTQATAATINEDTNTQAGSATDTSLVKQEALLANAENIFLGVRNSFERYKNFYDRLGRLNKSAPESFSSSLEELYKKAEKNLESMATLYHNIGSAKSEIEDIYEFANRLIDQSLDALNDEVGRENQLTTSSAFYEELRTPFIDIYRESQDIKADIQAGVAYREALDDIAEDWDTILDALREHEILYRNLRSGDINTDSFRDAAVNFEKTSAYLQLIKMLLNESRQCLAKEAAGMPTTDDICTTQSSVLAASRDVVNELDTELLGAQMDAFDDEDAQERMRQAIPRVDALSANILRFTQRITLGRDRSANLRDQICSASRRFSSLEPGA